MKGREAAEPISYFGAMEGLRVIGHKDGTTGSGSTTSFRRRLGSMLRSSALGSACSLTARNVSEAVQEPVFVSSRRLSGSADFRRLERVPSVPSSSASTTISGGSNLVADPRRGLLMPRHRRGQSVPAPVSASAVDLGICRPARQHIDDGGVRKDRRAGQLQGGDGRPHPRLMPIVPPVSRSVQQKGELFPVGKQVPAAHTEVSGNGFINDTSKGVERPSSASAVGPKKPVKKGKTKAPRGFRLSNNPYGFTSSSSGESDAGDGPARDALFSTDDDVDEDEVVADHGTVRPHRREDETETLFSSSRSFSSDSTLGMDYYYRSSRSNSSNRRRKKSQQRQQLLAAGTGSGKYPTGRSGGVVSVSSGKSSRAGSTRFDLDGGFRPLVSISSATTTRTVAAGTTTAACSSSTSTTTTTTTGTQGSGTSTASPSSASPLSATNVELLLLAEEDHADDEEEYKKSPSLTTPQQEEQVEKQGMKMAVSTPPPNDAAMMAAEEAECQVDDDDEDDGYAVVKESSDPYSDFRSSALEMIMERQLFGPAELERLLGAFLSLNHPSHHPVIRHVFSEIWQALFDNT